MASNVEKDLAEKLKSSSTSEIYKTLVKIRKNYVRSHDKMKKLEKYSVIKSIIPFMEHPKFCNISLSIIADGCLELSFVNEVIKCDGPKALMRIMNSSVNDDIHNRACRALGNIAKFDIGFKAVHLMKPVSNIINFLSETKDVNCQQTAVRTLMILGKSSKTRELIAQENGLIYIAKLLHSSDAQVLICSIKALANLTNNCTITCARQLLEFEFHKALVKLHSHSEKSVRNHALISLKNLSSLEEIRSGLVKVGAVKLFTEVLSAHESHETSRYAALALCRCLDHIHMWSHNGTDRSVGLKALLAVLKNNNLQDIHISVLTALIPLSFEFNVTDILLNLDVLQILIEILDSFIKRHECKTVGKLSYKYISDEESLSSDHKLSNKVDQLKYLATSSSQKLLESDLLKDKNVNSFEYGFKDSGSPKKSHDVYKMHKWDNSLYGLSSVTSDYSGSCSPTGTCSPPIQKRSTSPGFSYDVDVGSPSTGHTSSGIWSPASLIDENTPYNVNCWSPVVSTHSSSPIREFELMEYDENEYIMKDEFSLVENFNSAILDIDTEENTLEMSVSSNSNSLRSDTVEEIKLVSKLSKTNSYDDSKSMVPSKKLKTHHLHTDNPLELQFQTAVDVTIKEIDSNSCLNLENIASCSHDLTQKNNAGVVSSDSSVTVMDKESKTKDLCKSQVSECLQVRNSSAAATSSKSVSDDNEKPSDLKILTGTVDRPSIDRYVILFILQISFHIEKRTNSHMAEKSFFSVLIDYLCLIHKPCLKAETVLSNLIRNRYCLEKLIVNGFFCELEEKMSAYEKTLCSYHSHVLSVYSNLINVGRQEMESDDYGIGTLSRILITSDKKGQLHAICTLSKLVTEKISLYRLLIEKKGLSLLLEFLSNSDDRIRRKAVISLHKIYTSLTKKKKDPFKCCFGGTCAMGTSTKCFYKESFLNVTFVVSGGAKILANREKVCENSDYFDALLEGHFQESSSELVVFPHISAENLSAIFHFLHGCGNGNTCPYITRIPFSVLLELLSDSEKFLLTNIKTFVEDRLCHCLLPSQISKIYNQSKLHNSPALAKRALNEALRTVSSQKSLILTTFKELLDTASNVNVYSDIEELIKSLLL